MEIDQRALHERQKTPKGVWNVKYHKSFFDLSYEEMLKCNKLRTSFNKNGWNTLVANFEKKTRKTYNMKQTKNHWDCIKAD